MRRPIGLWFAILVGAARIIVSVVTLPFYGGRRPDDR